MTTWLELENEVKRLRGENAELLALLDAQSFGATQVSAQLEAADELADAVDRIGLGCTVILAPNCDEVPGAVGWCWNCTARVALAEYIKARAGNSVEPAKVATAPQGCNYYVSFDAKCDATPAIGNPPLCQEHAK